MDSKHEKNGNHHQDDSAWNFDPDWLICSSDDRVLEDISACPSWLDGNLTATNCREDVNLTSVAMYNNTNDDEPALRSKVSMLCAELEKKEVLTRHLTAQNLSLQNELSQSKREISEMKRETRRLHDHVGFLRHITAPTPDAGALDVSLSLLRGHELDRSRAAEEQLMKKCDALEHEKVTLELDLENERHARSSLQTSMQNEIDKLNQDISKFSILHNASQRSQGGLQQRLHIVAKGQSEREEQLKRELSSEKDQAIERERAKAKEMQMSLENRIKELQAIVDGERKTAERNSDRIKSLQEELNLAWAEVDGLRGGGELKRVDGESDLAFAKFRKEAQERERILRKEIQLLRAKVEAKSNESERTSHLESAPEDRDRLQRYHAQLERATAELRRAWMDNTRLRYESVANAAARTGLQTRLSRAVREAFMAPENMDVVEYIETHVIQAFRESQQLASKWENRADSMVDLARKKSAQAVWITAAMKAQELSLDKERKSLEYQASVARQERDTASREKAMVEADLAISQNEALRLETELARSRASRRTRLCAQCPELESKLRQEQERTKGLEVRIRQKLEDEWKVEKEKQIRSMQRKFASSFKKQVAKLLSGDSEISFFKPNEEPSSIVSRLATSKRVVSSPMHEFNTQDCTPPTSQMSCEEFFGEPNPVEPSSIEPLKEKWTLDTSFERWKQRKNLS